MSLGYIPLSYFWIAHYENGRCLPQFDPNTGNTNYFRDIQQNRLTKFGLYPFTTKLASLLKEKHNIIVRVNPFLRKVEVDIKEGQRLIYYRTETINQSVGTGLITGRSRKHTVIGWQETDRGKNKKSVVYVTDNGDVELRGE